MKRPMAIEDIPPEYRDFAELTGLDVFLRLVDTYGGSRPIYIPKLAEVERNQRNREILEGFTGRNYSELAKKHGLTEVSIRRILKSNC